MKNQKDKKKLADQEADRREFIKKTAKDIGACGYALFELARIIKEEVIQTAVDDIKEAIRKA